METWGNALLLVGHAPMVCPLPLAMALMMAHQHKFCSTSDRWSECFLLMLLGKFNGEASKTTAGERLPHMIDNAFHILPTAGFPTFHILDSKFIN